MKAIPNTNTATARRMSIAFRRAGCNSASSNAFNGNVLAACAAGYDLDF